MDTITSTQRKCKKKSVKKKIKVKGEDRISSLPDNIIQDILSLIPTHEAVSTSTLSTRWKYLWIGISSLYFYYNGKLSSGNVNGETLKFMDFVAKVLNLIDATVLNKFHLYCTVPLDMPRVNVWISTVVGRNVRELNIQLVNKDHPIIIPFLHLNCECLKIKCLDDATEYVLVCLSMSPTLFQCELLNKSCLEFIPKNPASISLSKLKVMRLSNTEISVDQELQQVSFSFPSLEEASLVNCLWVNVKTISFFVPRLKRLRIVNDDEERDDERRSKDEDYCKIKVYAESLVFLKLSIIMSFKVSLYNVTSLNEASIHTFGYDIKDDDIEDCLSKILGAVTNVRDLTISDATVDAICSVDCARDLLALSKFKNLRIDVQWKFLEGNLLMEFFRYLPNIESLFFSTGIGDAEDSSHYGELNNGWKIERTPQPILLNLKLVEITNSYGHENELSMVEYLLLNARALEKISITMYSNLYEEKVKEFAKKLLSHLVEQGQDFTFSCMNTQAEFQAEFQIESKLHICIR